MRFIKRYINYLVLLVCLIGLTGLFFLSFVPDQVVTISDPVLEVSIRELLDQPVQPLHVSELKKITILEAPGRGIRSLEGIQYLSNLTVLNLEDNSIQDVSPLATLRKLRNLNLTNNGLTDLKKANFEKIAHLPLWQLHLDYNVVVIETGEAIWLSDITVLGKFASLRELTLSRNKVKDISTLSSLDNLKTLVLENNEVEDISTLRQLIFLKTLNLGNNVVTDLTPLADLRQLVSLSLHGNRNILSLAPLTNLYNLKVLTLDNVPVGAEISVLDDKFELKELSAAASQITDISALKNLRNLTSLNLRDNDVIDLSPLSGLSRLEYLNIQSNYNVESVLPLENLKLLVKLDMQNVPVGDEVHILAKMNRLEFLDVRNCAIFDTTVLGKLMANGTLQDNQAAGITASIDLRDNPISVKTSDGYGTMRGHWGNISERLPFVLPDYAALAPPVFSVTGGFYNNPFELALTTNQENTRIYYTLDGSEPTQESLLYTSPIMIKSRLGEPNKLSEIREVSPRWMPPVGEVYKATIIRARVMDSDGLSHSPVVTNTYFVDETKKYTLPVISIVTNPEYLFDYKNGIYVMGEIYDQLYDLYPGRSPWERPANYNQRGPEWERPIHIEFFDDNGIRGFSQEAFVRIHGAASRERSEKSLRVYAGCENECSQAFDYEIFPGLTSTASDLLITDFKSFLLRNSGNDWEKTMFRDALVHSLVDHTQLDIQSYRPSIVFLNGEYWGIHNLRERQDEYYLKSHYQINPEDLVILTENAMLATGEPGDEQHYLDMVTFIETHDMKDPENYAYIKTQMDVDNYIDYQILEIYSDNGNWPHVNINYWRKKTAAYEPNAPYGQDGRWRWMVYDTDFAFGLNDGMNASANNNLINATKPQWHEWAGLVFRSLLKNPEFKTKFISRFADHLNTSFAPRRVLEKINWMQAAIEPEMGEHILRWRGNDGSLDAWRGSVDVMRSFAETRPQFMREYLAKYFHLGEALTLSLSTNQEMGYIRVNSIDIIEGTPGVEVPGYWTGTYFGGEPVVLTAIPYPGFQFAKWEISNGISSQSMSLTITLSENTTVRALFIKQE